jgi:hypothetical protein
LGARRPPHAGRHAASAIVIVEATDHDRQALTTTDKLSITEDTEDTEVKNMFAEQD